MGIISVESTSQGKGFAASLLVHLCILAVVVSTTTKIQPPPKLMVVDFSLLDSPAHTIQEPAAPQPPVVKPPEKIKPPTPPKPVLKKKVVKKLPKPIPVKKIKIAAIKPKPSPPVKPEPVPEPEIIPEPEVSRSEPQPQEQEPLLAQEEPMPIQPIQPIQRAVKALPNFPAPAAGKAKVNNDKTSVSRYTKAQFNHIQKGIQQQINYPRTARRMGWEGKVIVEFIICEDGTVKNLQIVESSGFKALDKNAVATIKKAAPFPVPPIPAKLIIPVVYRLS